MKCTKEQCFNCKYDDCINECVTHRKSSKEQIERSAKRRRNLKNERMSIGLCVNCGNKKPEEGYKMCTECKRYFRLRKEESNRRRGILPRELLDGVERCAKCGKYVPVSGYKLCERCLKSSIEHLEKTPTHNGKKQRGGFTDGNELFWTNKKQKEGK